MNNSRHIRILGCCNGLTCVLVDAYRFFLLNPSTRESKELPDFFSRVTLMEKKHGHLIAGYGFGFDESSDDYKIYAVFGRKYFPYTYIGNLYSLKADSWGRAVFDYEGRLTNFPGKFVSGKLHWISVSKSKSKWKIVCLDLKNETFGFVKHPITGLVSNLGVLDGCLCVFCDDKKNQFDIWILKEYGVEDSWSKYVTISYLSEPWKTSLAISESWKTSLTTLVTHLTPLFVLPNDEVLFAYGSVFFIYNKKDNSVRRRDTVGFDCDWSREVAVYAESLVSLVVHDGGGGGERGRKAQWYDMIKKY